MPFRARNAGGKLQQVELAGAEPVAGRGVAVGQLSNDGCMDAVVGVLNGRPVVFRNRGVAGNHWLTLYLVGTKSNRDGFGARVKVNGQYGYCTSTGRYLSAHDKPMHFVLRAPLHATRQLR